MKKLMKKNYASIVKRGLIDKSTTRDHFIMKIKEELQEFIEANKKQHKDKSFIHISEELADIILVCLNFATHYNIDIKHELKNKIKINERRGLLL